MSSISTAFTLPCPALCGSNHTFAGVCLDFSPSTLTCNRGAAPDHPDCLRRQVEADISAKAKDGLGSYWLDDVMKPTP